MIVPLTQTFGPVLSQSDRTTIARLPAENIQILFSAGAGPQRYKIVEEPAVDRDALFQ
jgi:hypothetical protein